MQRDPKWLAEKNAYEVYSGFLPNPTTGSAKGVHQAGPFVIGSPAMRIANGVQQSGPNANTTIPTYYELSTSNPVPGTWEPANGCYPNFGSGSSEKDDSSHDYCNPTGDTDFFYLCGPGAADVALWYWPNPNNNLTNNNVTDTAHSVTTTSWTSERMRGYMSYLAWQINWPSGGLPHRGMMDNTHYPSYATTLYGMQDALNWEETGHSTLFGFYLLTWWNQSSQSALLNDVTTDTYTSHVPVVAEVDASYLPKWPGSGRGVHHFITIIGYNNNTGIYYYTDTCGKTTHCNSLSSNVDGTVRTVSQSTMWTAITAIPVDTGTGNSQGDGGWVW